VGKGDGDGAQVKVNTGEDSTDSFSVLLPRTLCRRNGVLSICDEELRSLQTIYACIRREARHWPTRARRSLSRRGQLLHGHRDRFERLLQHLQDGQKFKSTNAAV